MKKSSLYKISALCLTFLGAGTFMAFDDAQTDEQKLETAYQQLVTDYNLEQDLLCKTQALAAAQAEWAGLQTGGTEEATSTAAPTTGSTSQSGGNEQPVAAPTPTPAATPTNDKKSKMSGGTTATASDKKSKMSGTSKSETGTTSTSDKKSKMKGK